MSKVLPLLLFIELILGQKEYSIDQIIEQNGVHKKKISFEIANGIVYQKFGDRRILIGWLKNGKKDSLWTELYSNGSKKSKTMYKDGLITVADIVLLVNGILD